MIDQDSTATVHLAVVENTETGLYHGAVYSNHPTPSGCDRWILVVTMKEGFYSVFKATAAVNAAFPEIEPLNMPDGEDDEDISDLNLPYNALVTLMTPRKASVDDVRHRIIQVSAYNSVHAPLLDIKITPVQLMRLEQAGKIVHESSSGDNPELQYRYDHYLVRSPHDDYLFLAEKSKTLNFKSKFQL